MEESTGRRRCASVSFVGRARTPTPEPVEKSIQRRQLKRSNTSAFSFSHKAQVDYAQKEHDRKAFLAHAHLVRRQLSRMQARTIDPKGRFLKRWDIVLVCAMFWTATVTPFEVAFLKGNGGDDDRINWLLFVLNRIIESIFVLDVLLNFFIPFRLPPLKGSRWVYDSRAIACKYVRTWFALDAVTAIPVDVIIMVLDMAGYKFNRVARKSLKLFKASKLLRLIRMGVIVRRWMSRLTVDPSILELVKFLVITVFMAHWLACIWGFVGNNYNVNTPIDLSTWYVADYVKLSWVQKAQMTEALAWQLYGASLYVSMANIFGGPCEINPANCVADGTRPPKASGWGRGQLRGQLRAMGSRARSLAHAL